MPTTDELVAERDAALILAEKHRRAILELAHNCEDGVSRRVIAARAREAVRVKGH